jgi:hypothetical protein
MKKIVAILLLFIFMFNLFGYKLYFSYLVENANHALESSLDKNDYCETDLLTIKIPISLPYYTNSSVFTRAYGEIEVKNILYKYVKTRIFNDSLEMLCIPNTSKQKLLLSKDKFTQIVFDVQKDENKKSSKQNSVIKLLNEYEKNIDLNIHFTIHILNTSINYTYISKLYTSFHTIKEQPPDKELALA